MIMLIILIILMTSFDASPPHTHHDGEEIEGGNFKFDVFIRKDCSDLGEIGSYECPGTLVTIYPQYS